VSYSSCLWRRKHLVTLDHDPHYMQNPLRQNLWRAGHAHAGVLLVLALIALRYVDEANLSERMKRVARESILWPQFTSCRILLSCCLPRPLNKWIHIRGLCGSYFSRNRYDHAWNRLIRKSRFPLNNIFKSFSSPDMRQTNHAYLYRANVWDPQECNYCSRDSHDHKGNDGVIIWTVNWKQNQFTDVNHSMNAIAANTLFPVLL